MARDHNRKNNKNHRPYERGLKTHRADVRQNRGEPEAPRPQYHEPSVEERESRRQEKMREEHPTRMKATGRNPDRRNR